MGTVDRICSGEVSIMGFVFMQSLNNYNNIFLFMNLPEFNLVFFVNVLAGNYRLLDFFAVFVYGLKCFMVPTPGLGTGDKVYP